MYNDLYYYVRQLLKQELMFLMFHINFRLVRNGARSS
jgi:hypothetical protein